MMEANGQYEGRIGLAIPTLDAGEGFERLLEQIDGQRCPLARKLVIDSSSVDGTAERAAAHGFETLGIPRAEFNHGLTRQQAVDHLASDVDVLIFLTQDVLLYDEDSFGNLVAAFQNPAVGAAYGRQLPHEGASFGAALQRQFSYGEKSRVITMADKEELGIRAAFLSDAFTAYRITAMRRVGGFPRLNVSEDMYMGAKLLMDGWSLAYVAGARVRHSHDFSLCSAWKRYTEIGKFQKQERWIIDTFGKSEGAGLKLLELQMRTAWKHGNPLAMLGFLLDDAVKYFAFRWGNR
ncbi:MAG: glycosyltransferase [Selenomonadaceae bacterium]|nr:glycosyltransferase [Selenomonadaceae bacterium]